MGYGDYDILTDPGNFVYVSGFSENVSSVITKMNTAGDLDPNWNGTGTTTVDLTYLADLGPMAIDQDGSIFIGSNTGELAKFKPNGTLDENWGDNGIVHWPARTADWDAYWCDSLQFDNNHSLYFACETEGSTVAKYKLVVAKYKSNGDLETGWADTGLLYYDYYGSTLPVDRPHILFDAQNRLYLSGDVAPIGWEDIFTVRYEQDGDVDNTWGPGGTGSESDWVQGPDFTTLDHPYPKAHFIPSLQPGGVFQFQGDSTCYDGNLAGETCGANDNFYWEFENGTPPNSSDQNPTDIQFNTLGPNRVTSTITDSEGLGPCSYSEIMSWGLFLPAPRWQEIKP
jgi:uncharacterized delta-60 repeat protein